MISYEEALKIITSKAGTPKDAASAAHAGAWKNCS